MTERPVLSARLLVGLVVLALGVLWTLENLGFMDASRIVRWWPLLALAWGLMRLTGLGTRRQIIAGQIWTIIGAFGLLHLAGLVRATVFDLWPLILIGIGASLIGRAWRGGAGARVPGDSGSRLNAFAFLAATERKVVDQEFRAGDVGAVMGGATVDFRPARLAENRAVLDVFAMWGGIELIVPTGWRVVGEVTPLLGAFVDSSAPPTDPAAPTLVVRGLVMMGGVEVRNDERSARRARVDVEPGSIKVGISKGGVLVKGIVIGGAGSRSRGDRPGTPRGPGAAPPEPPPGPPPVDPE